MILVTGGTGGVGSELLRLLSKAGIVTRALARHPQGAQALPGITWIAGDLSKPGTLTSAFEGARTLFLLTSYYEDMVELQHNAIFRSTRRRRDLRRQDIGIRRLGPLTSAGRPLALPGRERTPGIGARLDHSPASPFHAEPSCPG